MVKNLFHHEGHEAKRRILTEPSVLFVPFVVSIAFVTCR